MDSHTYIPRYSFLYHDAIAILPKSQHAQQMQGSNKDKYPNFPFVLKWLIWDYLISRSIKYLIMLVERKSVPIVWIKKKNLLHLFIQFSAKYFDRTRNSCDIFYSSTYQKCMSDIFSIQTTQVVVEQTNQSSFTK